MAGSRKSNFLKRDLSKMKMAVSKQEIRNLKTVPWLLERTSQRSNTPDRNSTIRKGGME